MFQLLIKTSFYYQRIKVHLIFSFLMISIYGCQDDTVSGTVPGPGNLPQANPYDWSLQYTEAFVDLKDIFFVDKSTGWVVGDFNTILSTTMGGDTWPQAPINDYDGNFRGVHMINSDKGWIAGDMNGKIEDGSIYLSINGGAYPEPQTSTMYPLNTVYSFEDDYVWSGGDNGQLLFTHDGGNNWQEPDTNLEIAIFGIHFIDKENGFISGSRGSIYKSTDGGHSWEIDYKHSEVDILAIHFIDSTKGWACGSRNTIFLFSNDGITSEWTAHTISSEKPGITWRDIFFIDDQTGWIVGNGGTVYRSEDGGKSWIKESTGLFADLNAIYMFKDQKGWIVGDNGVILTYTPQPE